MNMEDAPLRQVALTAEQGAAKPAAPKLGSGWIPMLCIIDGRRHNTVATLHSIRGCWDGQALTSTSDGLAASLRDEGRTANLPGDRL